jgi:hypothetical protein
VRILFGLFEASGTGSMGIGAALVALIVFGALRWVGLP